MGNRPILKLFKSEKENTMTDQDNKIGHNSKGLIEEIQELALQYAECDKESQELNDERQDIREKIADRGLDKKAWQDAINRAKQSLKKKEGYDESFATINEALGQMDMKELWSHVTDRQERKEREREERKAKRIEDKKKDDQFKSADERNPGEGKSIKKDIVDDQKDVA